ncbi:MAG TPA: Crp/Fnr family transcriptional regulator [Streptosporangiaceae bacterium]|nr:Crp/Fnr family transcriptional regulator [Streptosporangiaceae bacterium]
MSSSAGLTSLLPREAWQALVASGAVRRFERGEILMRQGEPGSYVFILAAGRVKIARVDAAGNELLLAIRGEADIVGELAVLGGDTRSATVTALSPCITYVLSAGAFLRIVRERSVEKILVRYLIARQRESDDARAELASLNATQRVGRVLLRFASVAGGEQPDLDLSQDELAAATGLSRASVAAALATLRQRGLVATGRRSLAIRDLAKLRGEFG